MDEEYREPRGADRFRLPMAMAKDAAAVREVYFDGFGDGLKLEGRAGEEVAHDGLEMGVGEAAAGDESRKAGGQAGFFRGKLLIFRGFQAHGDSAGGRIAVETRAKWGG